MTRSLEEKARESLDQFVTKVSKDKLRFAVCADNQKHSGTWAAWGNKSDFYIGARSILGSMKISLHASGICRVALNESQISLLLEQGLEPPADRAFVKWRRNSTAPNGARQIVSLIFPTDHFRLPAPVGNSKKPVLILGAQPGWKAVEVWFFYSRESPKTLEEKFVRIGNPLFHFSLDDGNSVSMVARETMFDPAALPTSEMLSKAAMRPLSRDIPEPGTERRNLTAAFWNSPKDGEALRVIEIGGVTLKRNASSYGGG